VVNAQQYRNQVQRALRSASAAGTSAGVETAESSNRASAGWITARPCTSGSGVSPDLVGMGAGAGGVTLAASAASEVTRTVRGAPSGARTGCRAAGPAVIGGKGVTPRRW
jgi:hypothetical protein